MLIFHQQKRDSSFKDRSSPRPDDRFKRESSLYRDRDSIKDDTRYSTNGRLLRRKSIEDDTYNSSTYRKSKTFDDDDSYTKRTSLRRPQLAPISSTYGRKSSRFDSDKDSDDDSRPTTRSGHYSGKISPPLPTHKYGSLDRLNGNDYSRGSSLAPIKRGQL